MLIVYPECVLPRRCQKKTFRLKIGTTQFPKQTNEQQPLHKYSFIRPITTKYAARIVGWPWPESPYTEPK